MQIYIYYISFAAFPFLALLCFFSYKKRQIIWLNKLLLGFVIILFILSISFIYARFIERNIIITKTNPITVGFSARIVVISDLHLGVFKNSNFLERIVKKINNFRVLIIRISPGIGLKCFILIIKGYLSINPFP